MNSTNIYSLFLKKLQIRRKNIAKKNTAIPPNGGFFHFPTIFFLTPQNYTLKTPLSIANFGYTA